MQRLRCIPSHGVPLHIDWHSWSGDDCPEKRHDATTSVKVHSQQPHHSVNVLNGQGLHIAETGDASQGGKQTAASFTRKHMLSGQTLEMLGDMRGQFASMLADIGFVRAPGRGGPRGAKGSAAWVDDRKAAWNQHSAQPAVVRHIVPLLQF